MPSRDFERIRDAIRRKQHVIGMYDGLYRELCPHVLGLTRGHAEQCLFYQFGGESETGLMPSGHFRNWRCMTLAGLHIHEIRDGEWHTARNHSRPQTCVMIVQEAVR